MAIKMVREPSETPNINNIDDIVPMRYAYGNQNGYVIGKGNEISNTVNGLNFTVNSGRLVLQGVECDIDAVGVTITIDNIATTRYYVVYLQVNLGTNTVSILSTYDTATYPTIDAGDDLTENTTGVARLPLYRFTATSGIISDVNKVVESVKYAKDITVENSKKINNIELKLDDNNKLTFGDNIVIPQQINIKTLLPNNQAVNIGSSSKDLSSFTAITSSNIMDTFGKYEIACAFPYHNTERKYLTCKFASNIATGFSPSWTVIFSIGTNYCGKISFYIDSSNTLYGNYIEESNDGQLRTNHVECRIYGLKKIID